ncbi:MFS transporter [Streptomyces fuscichromogenes]|uniref:MFS transporter n=1 Tax=Streptomyces fuscichromogenes TaxID=1324013 RepID=UPI003820593E
MNHLAPHERTEPSERAQASRKPIPPRAAFYLLASVVVSFLAASSAPTPLYATYQAEWGFTPITTTIVFGIYAIAVLSGLLVLGKLSDHVGRRPVLIAAIVAQAAAMLLFSTATGVGELLVGRVVQGLSTGAALGAIGAGMMDINRSRGTLANAFAPGVGTATGALVSGFVVQYLPAPTHTIYLGLLVVFAAQAVAITLIDETVTRAPGALASLVPEIRLPRAVRGAVLATAPVMFAVWALAGFYGSLGPSLVRTLVGSTSAVYGGLGLFVLAIVAAGSVLALRKAAATTVMYTGIAALVAGVTLTLVAVDQGVPALFFAGTAVAGLGFGSGFQGGIRTVMPLTRPHESSGVLSLLFVVSYLGMGAPSVLAGVLVVHGGGLVPTSEEYGAVVIALAVLALAALLLRGKPSSAPGVLVASGGAPAVEAEPARASR